MIKFKKNKLLSIVALLLAGTCMSCQNGPYGKHIEEDLKTTNIIEDNYRNYYEIFVRSFYDTNGDGIGDLQGVIQKLDYIKDMGFNGIWLMPINKGSSYHKYDVVDYYAVDSQFGTMDDLEELIEECHKRDIKLILDLVLNHSSSANSWFSKAKKAHAKELKLQELTEEENKFKDFYSFYSNKPSGITTYETTVDGMKFYYEANFSSGMPEFNCDSQAVKDEFKNIMKFYLDKGLDGFRLDAVLYYYYGNHAKNVEFLSLLNQWAKEVNPNAYIVGECWDSAQVIEQYYESGVDSFFNFTTSVNNPSSPIINSLNQEGKMLNRYYDGLLNNISMAKGHIPAPFLDNHDMPRYTSPVNLDTTKFKYALLSMMNGSTYTYYGDEIGMVGSNTGSNADQNVRISMPWGDVDNLGDCTMIAGVIGDVEYPHGTVEEQLKDKNSLYNFYKKCLLIRNQNPEIARGEVSLVKMDREDTKCLFIKKTYGGSEIGIIFNFSPTENLKVDYLSEGFSKVVGQIVVDNETYIGLQNDKSIMLPPYSIAIVK
ncbi:MAG: hypothetical protein J1F32_05570 [Erysipelotrichales bacterium]|nr:hypothetical protein [Erysipelotrichales bacterium]